MPGIGRFISASRLALVLGLLGVSAVFLARSVGEAWSGNAPVGALILSSSVMLLGLTLLPTVFPYGCTRCKVALRDTDTTLPSECFERLNQSIVQRNAEALLELRLEEAPRNTYAKLELEYCPRCQQIGRARALTQHYNGEFVKTELIGPREAVDGEFVSAALELIRKRALL
ncbi:MAG: hypothetical protein AB7K71_10790 [Polyangiaceae bacterium]